MRIGTVISMSITGNADDETFCPDSVMSCSTFGSILPNSFATTSSNVNVRTNSADGYYLSVHSTNPNANMRTEGGDIIAAGALTGESGGQGIWSYKTDNTGAITDWTAMGTEDTIIKGTVTRSGTTGDNTLVTYGLSTSNSQASGEYTTALVYTATAPNDSSIYSNLVVNLEEGIVGAQIREGSVNGSIKGLVLTSGEMVRIDPAKKYYIIPMYASGYTLGAITADTTKGSVTADGNAYGYYYYQSNGGATNTVAISGNALTTEVTDDSLPAMQTLASSSCPSVPTAVRDSRDNSVYYVQKLIDGNCWMLENLRLGPGNVLSPETSNVVVGEKGGAGFVIPASTSSSTDPAWANSYTDPYINSGYNTTTVTGHGAGRNYVGVYYNYAAASAGTINAPEGQNVNDDVYNVCPKNWTMPSGGPNGQYHALATMLGGRSGDLTGDAALVVRSVLSTPLSGIFNYGSAGSHDSFGYFWSISRYDGDRMHDFSVSGITAGAVYPTTNYYRNRGFPVRCVRQ